MTCRARFLSIKQYPRHFLPLQLHICVRIRDTVIIDKILHDICIVWDTRLNNVLRNFYERHYSSLYKLYYNRHVSFDICSVLDTSLNSVSDTCQYEGYYFWITKIYTGTKSHLRYVLWCSVWDTRLNSVSDACQNEGY